MVGEEDVLVVESGLVGGEELERMGCGSWAVGGAYCFDCEDQIGFTNCVVLKKRGELLVNRI